jgi:hypothetical protein
LTPELKAKWTAALRSGEYVQGIKRLFNKVDNTYCCLGVLCRVAGYDPYQETVCENETLTSFMLKQAGLTTDDESTLVSMNDGGANKPQFSFLQIANWIDANVRY